MYDEAKDTYRPSRAALEIVARLFTLKWLAGCASEAGKAQEASRKNMVAYMVDTSIPPRALRYMDDVDDFVVIQRNHYKAMQKRLLYLGKMMARKKFSGLPADAASALKKSAETQDRLYRHIKALTREREYVMTRLAEKLGCDVDKLRSRVKQCATRRKMRKKAKKQEKGFTPCPSMTSNANAASA